MTKTNFSFILSSLSAPEQALDLPRRELLPPELEGFTPRDLYEAAEYLLAVGNCDHLYSQIAVVTRAYHFGWVPSRQASNFKPTQPKRRKDVEIALTLSTGLIATAIICVFLQVIN